MARVSVPTGNPSRSRRKPESSSRGHISLSFITMGAMVPGLVPRLTVDDNLVTSNYDISQDHASVRRFVCGAVARTVGIVRAIVDDEMLAVSIELCQNALVSMPGICTIRCMVV